MQQQRPPSSCRRYSYSHVGFLVGNFVLHPFPCASFRRLDSLKRTAISCWTHSTSKFDVMEGIHEVSAIWKQSAQPLGDKSVRWRPTFWCAERQLVFACRALRQPIPFAEHIRMELLELNCSRADALHPAFAADELRDEGGPNGHRLERAATRSSLEAHAA
jgi:hypothetical protein